MPNVVARPLSPAILMATRIGLVAAVAIACAAPGASGSPLVASSGGGQPSQAAPLSPVSSATDSAASGAAGFADPVRLGNSGDCTLGNPPQTDPRDPATVPRVSLPPDAIDTLATGLCIPWGLDFLPDGTALITERGDRAGARILSLSPDGALSEVQRVDAYTTGEGGLLGIAVSPHYADDQWVYVYYSTATDNRVGRLHLGSPPVPILTGIPGGGDGFHNGGRIAFGPDGMLYVTTGETYYTRDIAQDRDSLGGKILRVTPDGEVPSDNPFAGSPVYSLGHRNVQGIAWDSSGQLYASELGEERCDELNRIAPGGNYGWPVVEGQGSDSRFIEPITTWCPTGLASPSGIAILGDWVYVACLRGQRLFRVSLDGRTVEMLLDGEYGRLRSVTAAADGSLWLLTTNRDGRTPPKTEDDDRILRIAPGALGGNA
jgi:glucose/arabinose dehydrogenase